MSQNTPRKKVAETCRFWREGKCQKREYQCNFVHGFICPNDGRCWKEHCNKVHLQKKIMPPRNYFPKAHMNYQRPGPRQRYRRSHSRSQSPQRHRKMPQRGRSPPRRRSRSRSPTYHTRVYSPYQRRSRSPSPFRGGRRSRSRSPSPFRGPRRSRSRSPSPLRGARRSRSRSWSPSRGVRKSRSRSLTPLRNIRRSRSRSQSPIRSVRRDVSPLRRRTRSRSRSGSWRRSRSRSTSQPRSRNYNQNRAMSRSQSPIRSRSKSRGLGKPYSRSPSPQPKRRSSSSSSDSSSTSSQSSKGGPSRMFPHGSSSLKDKNFQPVHSRSKTPVPENSEGDESVPQKNSSNTGRRMQLNLENLYDNLECETIQKSALSEGVEAKQAAEKEAISKLQAQLAKDFMNPETQKLMEKVLSLTKENATKSHQPEESKSKKEFFLDEVGDDIELDLEEVGEEVDDIFAKSLNRSVDESNEDMNIGLKIGSNPSPPKAKQVSKPEKSSDFDETDFHSDWDLKAALETASKSLKKPPQMPPPNQQPDGAKTGSSSLWTPALIRNPVPAPKNRVGYLPKDSDWEVETPYVGRKDKSEMQRPAALAKTTKNEQQPCDVSPAPFTVPEAESLSTHRSSHLPAPQERKEKIAHQKDVLFPSAQSAVSNIPTQVSHSFSQAGVTSVSQSVHVTGMMPPCAADLIRDATKEMESYHSPKEHTTASKKVVEDPAPYKPSESPKRSRKRHKEKKPKRKKESSDEEEDSSDSDDDHEDKKSPQENEKDTDELEVLLFKKESLMKRVKLLMEQKAMMSSQREDIIRNHKGSKANLTSILKENSFLIKEIGKQIGNIGSIIKTINHDIEVKRSTLKQPTSVSKGKSESPHLSREPQKTRHSAEMEKPAKKMIKPAERSESWNTDSGSRSPKGGLRRKRSESPGPNMPREGPRPVPPERKPSASPPRKQRPVKSTIEVSKKPAGHQSSQYQASKKAEPVHYAPYEAQRTYIRYIDQGMHWCKLCSLFCETALEYVDHLMTESHLGRVKNDRKSWLCRASKEEKEPKPLNAQVVTVPIQGMEFLHSLTSFYCSLCDTFMRDKGEALRHPESKMHVSKYKVHRAQNPLFESTFLKAKTTAYAKYKVDEERKKMENEFNINEKSVSLENKLLKQIKEKHEKENKEDIQEDPSKNCGSIRVASRGTRHSSDKKPSSSQHQPSHSTAQKHPREDSISKGSDDYKRKSDSLGHSNNEPQASQKKEPKESEESSNVNDVGGHERTGVEDQRESKYKEGSRDVDTDRKPVSSKLPLIGKMPFLKRKSGMAKSKEQQNTPVEELPKSKKESADEFNLSEKIPLPHSETKDSDVKKMLPQVEEVKEMPLSVRPVAAPVEQPVTSVESDDKAMTKNVPDLPLPNSDKTSETEEKDSHGSDLYDPLEAGNEDSSDGVAAATIEALDLLNIPLPGFKTTLDSQKTMLSDTEDKYQPEDMEIESTPLILEEEGIEEGKIMRISSCPMDTVHPSSGMMVHPGMTLMGPPVNLSNPPPMNLNNPPPPINLNNPPPPINMNSPLPPINLNAPPPPINLNPSHPLNLNKPPPMNLNNPPLPINLNTPPPLINRGKALPLMSINIPPPSMNLNDHPPPPGTEGPNYTPAGESNNIAPPGSMLTVFGPQEFIPDSTPPPIDTQMQDSEIPVPPGTEDEYTKREISTVSYSSGKHTDTVDQSDTQRHHSQTYSPKGSPDAPLSFSGNIIKGGLKSTKEPSRTQQSNRDSPHDREASTPPPPGTEGFPSETDSCDTSKSSKVSKIDLEKVPSKSPLVPSDLVTCANNEKIKLPEDIKSNSDVSETERPSSLQSDPDQLSNSETEVSKNTENTQEHGKDSSNKCLTLDTKLEELGSYPVRNVRSHSSSPMPFDKGNMATPDGSREKISDTPSKEPDKESIITSLGSTEERSFTLSSRELDQVKDKAAPCDKNEEISYTLPPKELDTENLLLSCRSLERPLTPSTKQLETEIVVTPCESQEESYKPQDQHSTVTSIANSQEIVSESITQSQKQPDTKDVAPSCESITQSQKQPDTKDVAPSCESITQSQKQPDTKDVAPSCESITQSQKQPDTKDVAPSCESITQSQKQPDTKDVAPSCEIKEQFHTLPVGQTCTENIAPISEHEGRPHTTQTVQPCTGNIALSSECKERLLTEQPDMAVKTISPDVSVDKSFSNPPEILTTLHGNEEWAYASQTKEFLADNITKLNEKDSESFCTPLKEPDEENKVSPHEKVKEKSHFLPSSEPDVNTIAYDIDDKRSCTSDLQPSTRSITTSHDSEEESICSSPSLHPNTRKSTTSHGSDEERSCATPLTQHKNSSSQSMTVDTDDNEYKKDSDCEDEDAGIEGRSYALSPTQQDTGNISSNSSLLVRQDSAEGSVSKEGRLNEQDGSSLSSLNKITEDSTECDLMHEKNLAHKSDVIDESESSVIKSKSPLQFTDFHKGLESMNIVNLHLPSTSDSVNSQSMNPNKLVSPQREDEDTSVTVKNVSHAVIDNIEMMQGNIDHKEELKNESDGKNQVSEIDESKAIQDSVFGDNREPLEEELKISAVKCSDSSKDCLSQKSTDSEVETLTHEISVEGESTRNVQKVQKDRDSSDETSKETEATVEDSAASTDKTLSSDDEVVISVRNVKGRKRKHNTRKTPRKKVAQFDWTEERESTPSRTSASRKTQSVVESPRPMRSSRRAAAAAIKAMAKDQDDTPPDSPPSDNDIDYSD